MIKDECQRIAIVLLIQTDSANNIRIHPEAERFYQEAFGSHLDVFKIIDLPPLRVEEVHSLITELAPRYQQSMQEELHLMTHVEDPSKSIRDPHMGKVKEAELRRKFHVNH